VDRPDLDWKNKLAERAEFAQSINAHHLTIGIIIRVFYNVSKCSGNVMIELLIVCMLHVVHKLFMTSSIITFARISLISIFFFFFFFCGEVRLGTAAQFASTS
jgi:hypothetical protein